MMVRYCFLFQDDVELYDKHLYRNYLLEEAADVEKNEEVEKRHHEDMPMHEIMLRIFNENKEKTKKVLEK